MPRSRDRTLGLPDRSDRTASHMRGVYPDHDRVQDFPRQPAELIHLSRVEFAQPCRARYRDLDRRANTSRVPVFPPSPIRLTGIDGSLRRAGRYPVGDEDLLCLVHDRPVPRPSLHGFRGRYIHGGVEYHLDIRRFLVRVPGLSGGFPVRTFSVLPSFPGEDCDPFPARERLRGLPVIFFVAFIESRSFCFIIWRSPAFHGTGIHIPGPVTNAGLCRGFPIVSSNYPEPPGITGPAFSDANHDPSGSVTRFGSLPRASWHYAFVPTMPGEVPAKCTGNCRREQWIEDMNGGIRSTVRRENPGPIIFACVSVQFSCGICDDIRSNKLV